MVAPDTADSARNMRIYRVSDPGLIDIFCLQVHSFPDTGPVWISIQGIFL